MMESLKELFDAVKPGFLGIAFAGALAAESFWPASSRIKTVANVGIGTMISIATAPLLSFVVVHNWPNLEPALTSVKGALYFWLGLLGMQIVPVTALLLKSVRLPWGNQ